MTLNKKIKNIKDTDVKKLVSILRALLKENNIEIIHLAIQSVLEELED